MKHPLTVETANDDTYASMKFSVILTVNYDVLIKTQAHQLEKFKTTFFRTLCSKRGRNGRPHKGECIYK